MVKIRGSRLRYEYEVGICTTSSLPSSWWRQELHERDDSRDETLQIALGTPAVDLLLATNPGRQVGRDSRVLLYLSS